MPDHESWMRVALEQARIAGSAGNRAIGAVIVRDDQIVAIGGNRRESGVDPLGHAETTAMLDRVAKSGSLDFSGCTLYTTLEPCPMCCGAIAVNNIQTIVVGAMHTPGNRRWGDYTVNKVTEMIGQGAEIIEGVLEDDCNTVLHEFDVKLGRA
ncbi:MAG: nucleoside deaminase [Chloroflexi bacterium]|nr:nucleoside deaminase [Chloroflexota bacterium]